MKLHEKDLEKIDVLGSFDVWRNLYDGGYVNLYGSWMLQFQIIFIYSDILQEEKQILYWLSNMKIFISMFFDYLRIM